MPPTMIFVKVYLWKPIICFTAGAIIGGVATAVGIKAGDVIAEKLKGAARRTVV